MIGGVITDVIKHIPVSHPTPIPLICVGYNSWECVYIVEDPIIKKQEIKHENVYIIHNLSDAINGYIQIPANINPSVSVPLLPKGV